MSHKARIIGILIIIAFFLGLAFGLYADFSSFAEQTHPLKIWAQNENGDYHTLIVHDEETGVEYVVVSITSIIYSKPSVSIAITPRLSGVGSEYYRTK